MPLEYIQGFSRLWPGDLVFDPTWPVLKFARLYGGNHSD